VTASRPLIIKAIALAVAAVLCVGAASVAASLVENRSVAELKGALTAQPMQFVEIDADGLLVTLSGTAPDEATRFTALSIAGGHVAPDRLIDAMDVADSTGLLPLRFSIEMLRNDDGIQLIGLIPAATGRAQVLEGLDQLDGTSQVADMLETADHAVPDGWNEALEFALDALRVLPRSKISVAADRVAVTALSNSPSEKAQIEAALSRAAPDGMELVLDINAPRPVITPFTLRFSIEEGVATFDVCSADTDHARDQIVSAAAAAGVEGKVTCNIGLGVPSPRWAEAVQQGIAALRTLEGGTLTFSDADVTLVALAETPQPTFDRVVGELENALPPVFSLHSILPEPVRIDGTGGTDVVPEFVSTLSPEGLVQLRGRVADDQQRNAVNSYAQSLFGTDQVYSATRLDPNLPDGWPVRVLAGLQALSELNNGSLVVQPDFVELIGTTGNPDANGDVARLLADKLGEAEDFRIAIRYEQSLDPALALPTPEECAVKVNAALTEKKITFEAGSATIADDAQDVVDRIAEIVRACEDVAMEIAGHTDSQGREEMNTRLSQQRAEAVLTALLDRRVLTTNLIARGYGESNPIADNDTAEGREANRRIEFRVLLAEEAAAAIAAQEEATE
jgi:OOP family OmpA-OmpF porin